MDQVDLRHNVVLIIDSDVCSAARCKALTCTLGATAWRVASLEAAALVLTQVRPDVIIAGNDVARGGVELVSELRQRLSHRHTPIILLTGELQPAELERAAMAGMYASLAKPVNALEFMKLTRRAILEAAEKHRRRSPHRTGRL